MIRTIYEVHNEDNTFIAQFLQEADAINYAQQNNMSVRQVEQEYEEYVPPRPELTSDNWLNLERDLYKNFGIVSKVLNSTGNAAMFLLRVLSDGKTTGASEQALQLALSMLLPVMNEPFSQEEVNYINQALEDNNFETRI
jgi:hypothetical protein